MCPKLVNLSGMAWRPHFARVNPRGTGFELIDDPRPDLLADDFVKNRVILLPRQVVSLGAPGHIEKTVPDPEALAQVADQP